MVRFNQKSNMVDYDEEPQDDMVERLLELGREKKFLSFEDLNRELPDSMVSPEDIEDVLQKIEGASISIGDGDSPLLETPLAADVEVDEDEEFDLDLSAGTLDKTNDPVRLYLREMGIVPLLTREGEVAIAKRIERGQIKTQKSISRSPIAVEALLRLGEALQKGKLSIRDTVMFSEQAELTGEEDKADEYMRWTLEGIERISDNYTKALKAFNSLIKEQDKQKPGGKPGKRLVRLRREMARLRLEIADEIKWLNLTERAKQRLIEAIRKVADEIRASRTRGNP